MSDPKWIARLCLGSDLPCRVWVHKSGEVHLFAHKDAKPFIHLVDGPKDGPAWGAVLGNANDARRAIAIGMIGKRAKLKKENRNGTA